jgi:hypothetical protein
MYHASCWVNYVICGSGWLSRVSNSAYEAHQCEHNIIDKSERAELDLPIQFPCIAEIWVVNEYVSEDEIFTVWMRSQAVFPPTARLAEFPIFSLTPRLMPLIVRTK